MSYTDFQSFANQAVSLEIDERLALINLLVQSIAHKTETHIPRSEPSHSLLPLKGIFSNSVTDEELLSDFMNQKYAL